MELPTRAERRALRKKQREETRALKTRLKEELALAKSRPEIQAALKRKRTRQVKRAVILVGAFLVLILFPWDCTCDPGPAALVDAGPVPEPPDPVAPPEKPAKKKPKKKRKLAGKIDKEPRENMDLEAPPAPPWLAQFRLQIAARSPTLAQCFNGVDKPGALRWSALVEARSGRVSESKIEPVLENVAITTAQETCLIKGLTETPYKLDEPNENALARRVSLIFEF